MSNILVVGGAGGVGSALVAKLAERGDAVATTVLNEDEAASVRAAHGSKVAVHIVDMGDADAALIRFREVIAAMPGLDAVAVCAAIAPNGPVELVPLAEYRKLFEVNCLADVALFQAAMPALRDSQGRIIFVSSVSGRIGMPFVGAYTASKFALEGVADVMRREVAHQGVKVSLIEPGGIRTPMLMQLPDPGKRVAALDADQAQRYGALYHRFSELIADVLENSASTPESIADVIIEALDAEHPEARYPGGADAKTMLDMVATMTERDADQLFGGMYLPDHYPEKKWG